MVAIREIRLMRQNPGSRMTHGNSRPSILRKYY